MENEKTNKYWPSNINKYSEFIESSAKDGDLYIRSVCFSPDGQYLATGAEDKLIRVLNYIIYFFIFFF